MIDSLLWENQDADITFWKWRLFWHFPNLVRWSIWHVLVSPTETAVREMSQGLYLFCNFFGEYVCGALSWLDCESLIINRSTSSIYDLLNETRHVVTMDKMACFRYCNITALNNYHNDPFLSCFPQFNCTVCVCVCAFQLSVKIIMKHEITHKTAKIQYNYPSQNVVI